MTDSKKKAKAVVIIKASWIVQAGLETLFKAGATLSNVDRLLTLVTAYDITDSAFIEITFYPKTLNGRWAKVFIPKHEVLGMQNWKTKGMLLLLDSRAKQREPQTCRGKHDALPEAFKKPSNAG